MKKPLSEDLGLTGQHPDRMKCIQALTERFFPVQIPERHFRWMNPSEQFSVCQTLSLLLLSSPLLERGREEQERETFLHIPPYVGSRYECR
jgi:hypothetical protein